ncbi:MAG: HNH endonuclease [Deltaproteobacteria bacterium]|nr:HNH endonuclease [Deltaproteobacteria bacterium]
MTNSSSRWHIFSPSCVLSDKIMGTLHHPKPSLAFGRNLCLPWEFGFTCSFCLLHENDFRRETRITSVVKMTCEHIVPKSADPSLMNTYSNLVWACEKCNRSRSTRPVIRPQDGAHLLNPREVIWSQRFSVNEQYKIIPRCINDKDADYTIDAYDVNTLMKQKLRENRHIKLTSYLTSADWKGGPQIDVADPMLREHLLFFRLVPGNKEEDPKYHCGCELTPPAIPEVFLQSSILVHDCMIGPDIT